MVLNENMNLEQATVGIFSNIFKDVQLEYPVEQQELLAAHEGLRLFEPIIKGYDITIMTDHLNNTVDCANPPNLRTTWQLIELDQEYHVKWKHIACKYNWYTKA